MYSLSSHSLIILIIYGCWCTSGMHSDRMFRPVYVGNQYINLLLNEQQSPGITARRRSPDVLTLFTFKSLGFHYTTTDYFDRYQLNFSDGEVSRVSLSASEVKIYGNQDMWLGSILTSGVPQFNGTVINYLFENGTVEAAVFVVVGNPPDVDMALGVEDSLITFLGEPLNTSVTMDIGDMILPADGKITLNQTHLIYGSSNESLYVPGDMFIDRDGMLTISGDSNFTMSCEEMQGLTVNISERETMISFPSGHVMSISGKITHVIHRENSTVFTIDGNRDIEVPVTRIDNDFTGVRSLFVDEDFDVKVVIQSELYDRYIQDTTTTQSVQDTNTTQSVQDTNTTQSVQDTNTTRSQQDNTTMPSVQDTTTTQSDSTISMQKTATNTPETTVAQPQTNATKSQITITQPRTTTTQSRTATSTELKTPTTRPETTTTTQSETTTTQPQTTTTTQSQTANVQVEATINTQVNNTTIAPTLLVAQPEVMTSTQPNSTTTTPERSATPPTSATVSPKTNSKTPQEILSIEQPESILAPKAPTEFNHVFVADASTSKPSTTEQSEVVANDTTKITPSSDRPPTYTHTSDGLGKPLDLTTIEWMASTKSANDSSNGENVPSSATESTTYVSHQSDSPMTSDESEMKVYAVLVNSTPKAFPALEPIPINEEEGSLHRLPIQITYVILFAAATLFVVGGIIACAVHKFCVNRGESYRLY